MKKNRILDFRLLLEIVIAICFVSIFSSNQAQANQNVEINHLNEVTHLEFSDVTPADYNLKKSNKSIELSVNPLPPLALEKLRSYTDRFIKKIDIKKNQSLSRDIIEIELADESTEIFDYLTDSPSSLSIDIYLNDNTSEKDNAFQASQAKSSNRTVKFNDEIKMTHKGRDVASSEFIKTIGKVTIDGDTSEVKKSVEKDQELIKQKKEINKDLQRIVRLAKMDMADILKFDIDKVNFSKDSLIEGVNRIYIKYPILMSDHKILSDILQKDIRYEIGKNEDAETQDFIKVKNFFKSADSKNFLKAKNIYSKKFPKSKYNEMLAHMEAEVYLKLYNEEQNRLFFDKSLKIYDGLLSKFPDSPISERTLLLVAYLRLKDKNYFDASRNLKSYLLKYTDSPLRENIQLVLAQALLRLHEYQDAKKMYTQMFNSEQPEIRVAANYEYGDVFFEERDYQQALIYYNKALAQFPDQDKNFPNIYFNKGEAEFLLGKYKESLEDLRRFISQHPLHDYASFAWTRMGEIFEMSEVDEKIWKGYYNESFFRFQNRLGGSIAKINLLYHQAISSPENKFDFIINQMKSYENQIQLPQANEYLHFKISDAYYETKKFRQAAETLIAHFKKGDVPEHTEKFHKRIGRAIAGELRQAIEKNSIVSGLKIFDETDELWFKKSQRFDFNFYKAELYRLAKLPQKSLRYYDLYLKDFSRVKDQAALDQSQRLPQISEVQLYYSMALFDSNELKKSRETLEKVDIASLKPMNQDQFYFLQAQLDDKEEKYEKSLLSLEKIKSPNLDHNLFIAETYFKSGKTKESISYLNQIIDSNKGLEKERFTLLKKKLEILEDSKDKSFNEFLARFYSEFKETAYDFDREKYIYFKLLSQTSKTKEAEEVLSKIQPNSYWAKLANEIQQDNQWSQKYKKYVDRIPAMQNAKEPENANK